MDRFSEIETFVAVVEAGSLSGAAKRLGVAVSAVSRRMNELEARLGVRLANRSTRGFATTPLGLQYYEDGVRLLADLAQADGQARGSAAALTGTVRIAAPLSFGIKELAPVLADIANKAPSLRLDIDFSDRRVDVVSEGFDLAIRIGELEDSSLIARKLFDVRHVLAASPYYWERAGIPATPDNLAQHAILAYRGSRLGTKWRYRDPNGREGMVSVAPRIIANNGDALAVFCERGLGVILEPEFIVRDAIARGALASALDPFRFIGVAAYAVYPPGRALPARARHVLEGLTAVDFAHAAVPRA